MENKDSWLIYIKLLYIYLLIFIHYTAKYAGRVNWNTTLSLFVETDDVSSTTNDHRKDASSDTRLVTVCNRVSVQYEYNSLGQLTSNDL